MCGLNITPVSIVDIAIGIVILVSVIIAKSRPQSRGIISFNFLLLAWVFFALLVIFESISIIFLDLFISILSNLFPFYGALAILISLSYMKNETYYSPPLLGLIIFGTLYHVAAFLPGSVAIVLEDGYLTISWSGAFEILGILVYVILGYLLLYWGFKTWRNAPFELKREAKGIFEISLFSGISTTVGMIINAWFPIFLLVTDFFALIVVLLFIYIFAVHPKLCYVLSFSIYKMDIRDSQGNTLFVFDWAKTNLKYSTFSRYLANIQKFSDPLLKSGGVVDLTFPGCQIIVYESKYVTTILYTSKSSRVLRDSLLTFSKQFEETFEILLKDSVIDRAKYQSANQLLQKYFANFPSRMIVSKQQKFFISQLEQNLSPVADSRIKQIFGDEEEYGMVRDEMEKVPRCIPDSFVKLYDELKDENEEDKAPTQKKEDSPESNHSLEL